MASSSRSQLQRPMSELQCVILAQASPSLAALQPAGVPQGLLPVAGQPLLALQLRHLERVAGGLFSSVLIVASDATQAAALATITGATALKVEIVVYDALSTGVRSAGSAEMLRSIKGKLHSDFFVLSTSELLTEASLLQIADVHRVHDASCTVLMYQSPVPLAASADSGVELFRTVETTMPPAGEKGNEDFVAKEAVAESGNQGYFFGLQIASQPSLGAGSEPYYQAARLVLTEPIDGSKRILLDEVGMNETKASIRGGAGNDTLFVEKSLLKVCPRISIHTDLRDAHLYLFRHWVLDLLDEREDLISIEEDLVPFLVSGQFHRRALPEKLIASGKLMPKQYLAHSMSSHRGEIKQDDIKCFALVITRSTPGSAASKLMGPPPYCATVQDLASYHRINMDIMNLPSSAIWEKPMSLTPNTFKGSLIGKDCVIGDQVSLKNCVIGANCKIGAKCKLNNCVVMDDVTMDSDVVVQNSIICTSVHIKEKCNLNECVVVCGVQIKPGTRVKGEAIFS